jgi:hypothetical protein
LDELADELGETPVEVMRRALGELYERTFRRGGEAK